MPSREVQRQKRHAVVRDIPHHDRLRCPRIEQ
jgi:hypothetical protein